VPNRLSLRLQRDELDPLPLVGSSLAMRELARQVALLAEAGAGSSLVPVLLIGETGTGKGRMAEYIHARSPRSAGAFVDVNCAGMEPRYLGAELFGDDGSPDGSQGILSAVRGGSIFVDEVSELPAELQVQLLRVLDDGADLSSDSGDTGAARVIAAASRDLVNEVNAGRFREDLYYRLGAAPLYLPPLRARSREDLSELITATFNALSMNMSGSPRVLGDDVIDCLIAYPWPGNIRELRNAIERGLLVARGEAVLRRMHLPTELHHMDGADGVHVPRTLMDVERAHIHRTLRAHNLNRTHAARELGISRATLIKKIKEYGLVYRSPDRA
jgi:transcriptional regulator with PAS, ATPase and Fis domain